MFKQHCQPEQQLVADIGFVGRIRLEVDMIIYFVVNKLNEQRVGFWSLPRRSKNFPKTFGLIWFSYDCSKKRGGAGPNF